MPSCHIVSVYVRFIAIFYVKFSYASPSMAIISFLSSVDDNAVWFILVCSASYQFDGDEDFIDILI
jgi:hypothetical protein